MSQGFYVSTFLLLAAGICWKKTANLGELIFRRAYYIHRCHAKVLPSAFGMPRRDFDAIHGQQGNHLAFEEWQSQRRPLTFPWSGYWASRLSGLVKATTRTQSPQVDLMPRLDPARHVAQYDPPSARAGVVELGQTAFVIKRITGDSQKSHPSGC